MTCQASGVWPAETILGALYMKPSTTSYRSLLPPRTMILLPISSLSLILSIIAKHIIVPIALQFNVKFIMNIDTLVRVMPSYADHFFT